MKIINLLLFLEINIKNFYTKILSLTFISMRFSSRSHCGNNCMSLQNNISDFIN